MRAGLCKVGSPVPPSVWTQSRSARWGRDSGSQFTSLWTLESSLPGEESTLELLPTMLSGRSPLGEGCKAFRK